MRAALVAGLVMMADVAHAQIAPSGHAGLDEFTRICLKPRTLEFTLSASDQERLGFKKDDTVYILSEELAKKYNVPESERMQGFTPAYIVHGFIDDPYAFSIWSRAEKSYDLVQRVDAGRGLLGVEGNSAPAHFCSVLTIGDADKATKAFVTSAESAISLTENHANFLFGHYRAWLIELPWAPDQVGIVTIADMRSIYQGKAVGAVTAALFVIETVSASALERVLETAGGADRS